MTDFRKKQMRKECVERVQLSLGKKITPTEASDLLAQVRARMAALRLKDPVAWDAMSKQARVDMAVKEVQEAMMAEALKIKQRARLTVLAQARVEKSMATARKRGYHGYSAGMQVLQEVDRYVQATQSEVASDFLVALEGKQKGILGLMEDKSFARDVVREVYGQDTGSKMAKEVAGVWVSMSDSAVDRFNAAGGNLGKIEHYVPQTHDDARMRQAAEILKGDYAFQRFLHQFGYTFNDVNPYGDNQMAWVSYVFDRIDKDRYVDLNGEKMSDEDIVQILSKAYDTIVQNGAENFEISAVAGEGFGDGASRANRGDLHRSIHFKDAESFIEYQEMFGHGSFFGNMLGSLRRTAKDAALLEMMGPNPNNMNLGVKRMCQAEADQMNGRMQGVLAPKKTWKIGLSSRFYDSAWSVLNGEASMVRPDRAFVASLMGGVRNLEVVGKLQSTFINSLPDVVSYFVTSRLNKTPLLRATANLCKAWGSESKDIAKRAGLMADALASNLDRFGQNNVGQGWTGMLANTMMKLSLLDQWTNGVRQASMINMMGTMALVRQWDWNGLEPFQKRQLERLGVTERDWRLWQAAKPYKAQNGASVLTRQDIREVDLDKLNGIDPDGLSPDVANPFTQRDVDHAVSTYVAFLRDESGLASLAPDLRTRALSNIAGERGTFGGEVVRSLLLFKSFPIGFVLRHLERMSDLSQMRGKASSVKYAASIVVGSTVAAAISVQLKQLIAGRDVQDMTDDDFWWQALSTGGGLSFISDLIIAGVDGQNAYGSQNFLKFLGPVVGTVLDTFDVIAALGSSGIYSDDKETKVGAKALRLARGHMPFVNLWYTKAVFDRAIYNDLMEFCSPGYTARMEAWGLKNTGQEYWWAPTKLQPTRMPKMATNPDL